MDPSNRPTRRLMRVVGTVPGCKKKPHFASLSLLTLPHWNAEN